MTKKLRSLAMTFSFLSSRVMSAMNDDAIPEIVQGLLQAAPSQ